MATHAHTTPRKTDAPPPSAGPSRRSLLAAWPAVLALGGAAAAAAQPPPNPDAALIALCARYVAEARAFCGVNDRSADLHIGDPEERRLHATACAMVPGLHAMADEIADTPAHTVLGLLAKAEAARHQMSGDADRDTGPMDPDDGLAWSLVLETLPVLGRA